jgi:hypothetical protein
MSTIDWAASARLSAARSRDEFVVRQTYSEETPHALVVNDRGPSMALYPQPSPWLDKPAAVAAVLDVVSSSVAATQGLLGYIDHAGGRDRWLRPSSDGRVEAERRHQSAAFDAPAGTLAGGVDLLLRHSSQVPAGSFVFLVSDFLQPLPAATWVRLRRRQLDVVAVVVQDRLWESSFPAVEGVVVPFADPATGRLAPVRLTRSESRRRTRDHEERLRTLLHDVAALGFDAVRIDSSDTVDVLERLLEWADRRRLLRRLR